MQIATDISEADTSADSFLDRSSKIDPFFSGLTERSRGRSMRMIPEKAKKFTCRS